MKTKLICATAAACAAFQLAAMPTEEETRRAEPVVQKMLARERAALESGRKTRSQVAESAMRLGRKADSEAEKLLLMKGAYNLYVREGEFDKAIETLQTMMTDIPDIPPAKIVSIMESSLRDISRKDGKELYTLLDNIKARLRSTKGSKNYAARQTFARMFPGGDPSVEPAIVSSHRGEDNVAYVHPPSQETPSVVSRTMTLSKGNPCLFLKMSSFSKDYDFLLSVLVNGKEVLPKRLVRTPDSAPWEDIVVPLSAWRGEKVKIEVVLAANNWYCEHPFFKRLEVAEGGGNGTVGGGSNQNSGVWTVAQYNGSSEMKKLAEAQKLVDETSKVAEQTYPTLSLANDDNNWGDFPHVEFPGTTVEENTDYFVITAAGRIYVPEAGDWTFACRGDDGFRFTVSGNGLSDTFENDGIRGFYHDPLLHTVHFPCAGTYSVDCLYFENWGNAGLEYSVARGKHEKFDASVFKLVGDPESGIAVR